MTGIKELKSLGSFIFFRIIYKLLNEINIKTIYENQEEKTMLNDIELKYVDENSDKVGDALGIEDIVLYKAGMSSALNVLGYFAAKGLKAVMDSNEETPFDDLIVSFGGPDVLMEMFENIGNAWV